MSEQTSEDPQELPEVFGTELKKTIEFQRSRGFSSSIPLLLLQLINKFHKMEGEKTEGIFRFFGDVNQINIAKKNLKENFWHSAFEAKRNGQKEEDSELDITCSDTHSVAQLIIFWLGELPDRLIPKELAERALNHCQDAEHTLSLLNELDVDNRNVILAIIELAQFICKPENMQLNKMGIHNTAIAFSSFFISVPTELCYMDYNKEISFVKTLILNLPTPHKPEKQEPPLIPSLY
eukprot:TRINITY_DN4179_c0_g1_i1.p1 TRINITY_DN4179_c0_g1~~TRINITY_DN4179_c0_g1_i1.p1  ORF type:complete len:236 (-),score=86.07 TRINITY_DN4179_c0_g1_i1:222-929(-)